MAQKHPDRAVFWGSVNPLEGKKALDLMERQVKEYGAKAFKFYNVRYDYGQPFPWRMDDPRIAYPVFEHAQELGVNLIGVHKGVPLGPQPIEHTRTFDMDGAAANFPDINFVIFHVGLPWLDEVLWQIVRYPNLYASIAATVNFISRQPRVFAEMLGKMMWWCGEDKIIYGGESPIWHPQWALEEFWNFELPRDIVEERGYPQLTEQAKRKILGGNLARLHGIDVEAKKAELGVPFLTAAAARAAARAVVGATGFIGPVHGARRAWPGPRSSAWPPRAPSARARRRPPRRRARVRLVRGAGGRRRRRRRPHLHAEPPAPPAGRRGARGRQARRLREAARADAAERRAARSAAADARTASRRCRSSTATTRWCARPAPGSRRRDRRGAARPRRLPAGLAARRPRTTTGASTRAGRRSRAFADIGSHWCDLIEFVTGQRIARVRADAPRSRAPARRDAPAFAAQDRTHPPSAGRS